MNGLNQSKSVSFSILYVIQPYDLSPRKDCSVIEVCFRYFLISFNWSAFPKDPDFGIVVLIIAGIKC